MSSKVYFVKASMNDGSQVIAKKSRRLFKAGGFASCFHRNDITAIKIHVGEGNNNTHIPASFIKGLVDELLALETKPFLTDAGTLYMGRRRNAIDHMVLASEHGFSLAGLGVPFIVSDGLLGTSEAAVKIDGHLNEEVYIASDIQRCQSLLSVAHMTGHMMAGMGGTLKTLGMGCASKKGKMKQHAAMKLSIGDDCTRCGLCLKHCPADAITLDKVKAHIDQDKCIGCAECLAVCRFKAVQCNWGEEVEVLQKGIAEYALGALKGKEKRAAFFNFILSVTKDCDCFSTVNMPKIVDDIGIIASADPVAVDKAALDMVEQKAGKNLQKLLKNRNLNPLYQIEHAERIGLGSSDYELVEVKL
jgi:uncharacterized Fe-S center protein